MQAGKVRLIFVSDEIPTELRRIVEFLNQQMDPVEVLAVEIKQHIGEGVRAFVPRLIGQTAEAQQRKAGTARGSRKQDEGSFFRELEAARGIYEAKVARSIFEWAKSKASWISWGTASFTPMLEHAGLRYQVVGVYTDGSVEIKFAHMQDKPPFDEEAKRLALRDRLNGIMGIDIPATHVTGKRPGFYLSVLENETDLERLLTMLDWFVEEARAYVPRTN